MFSTVRSQVQEARLPPNTRPAQRQVRRALRKPIQTEPGPRSWGDLTSSWVSASLLTTRPGAGFRIFLKVTTSLFPRRVRVISGTGEGETVNILLSPAPARHQKGPITHREVKMVSEEVALEEERLEHGASQTGV